jgi:hypothetical protein
MEYLNSGAILGTGYSTTISATTTTKYLVKTVHACNVYSGDTSFHLQWYDNSVGSAYTITYNVTVPEGSSFQALDGTFVLDNNDYLQAKCGNDTAIELSISYLQITNTEG